MGKIAENTHAVGFGKFFQPPRCSGESGNTSVKIVICNSQQLANKMSPANILKVVTPEYIEANAATLGCN